MIGETISNYRLLSKIGEGGMGVVYLGEQINLNRKVAIKELNSELTSNPQFKDRFINEAKILAQLSHPNIVTVYDLISDNGRYFIVMEYVTGESVSGYITRTRTAFELNRCVNIFRHILSAFSYAHNQGIIHRDIKPSNIILQQNDVPKVLDFGIAKITNANTGMTKTGTMMGSVFYMSPEQVMGEPVDKRTDIYSLGITFFEMLTGSLPFDVNTDSEYKIQTKIVNEPLPSVRYFNPRIPVQIDSIIAKATAKKPQDRFSGCEEFYYAFENNSINFSAPDAQKTVLSGTPAQTTGNQPSDATKQVVYRQQPVQNIPDRTIAAPPPPQPVQQSYLKPKKKTSILLFIIPLLFIVVIAGAIIVYLYLTSDNTTTTSTSNSNKNAKTDPGEQLKQREEELKKREQKIDEEKKNLQESTGNNQGGTNTKNPPVPGLYPESSTKYLTERDLYGKSKYDLKIMRNEIYARHGYIFKSSPDMMEYFNSQSWYKPGYNDVSGILSDLEQANIKFIQAHEK